jgi:Fe-S-cluster containining protein
MSFQHKPNNTSIEPHQNKETGRSCGSCSMCCYLPLFKVGEWKKPTNQWCQHFSGHSCNIYAERPDVCREFECMWLANNSLPDHWYPTKSKIIVTYPEEHGAPQVERTCGRINGATKATIIASDNFTSLMLEKPRPYAAQQGTDIFLLIRGQDN